MAGAITASTLTTVAVFLPLGFVGGLVSQFFLPFALTVTFALLASLVCALTVVPVLAYLLVDRVKIDVDEDGEPTHARSGSGSTRRSSRCALSSRLTQLGGRRRRRPSCSSRRSPCCPAPDPFINAGSREDPPVSIVPPPGRPRSVLDRTDAGRGHPRQADPDVKLVASTLPGDGDTATQRSLGVPGPGREQLVDPVRLDPSVDLKATTERIATDLGPIEARRLGHRGVRGQRLLRRAGST